MSGPWFQVLPRDPRVRIRLRGGYRASPSEPGRARPQAPLSLSPAPRESVGAVTARAEPGNRSSPCSAGSRSAVAPKPEGQDAECPWGRTGCGRARFLSPRVWAPGPPRLVLLPVTPCVGSRALRLVLLPVTPCVGSRAPGSAGLLCGERLHPAEHVIEGGPGGFGLEQAV